MRAARPTAGFVIVNTLMLWLATAVASVELWPIYRSSQLIYVIAITVVVGSLIAILGAVFRWVAPIVLGATVLAFFALGVPLAVPAKTDFGVLPSGGGLLDLTSGVALGWKQLLTITLPVGQYESLLVPFYALILVLTVLALSIALRTRRGDVAPLGPVLLFIVAIAFGSTVALWPVEISLGLLVVSLVWIIWRRSYRRRIAIRVLAGQAKDAATAPVDLGADARFVRFRTVVGTGLILVLAVGTAVGAAAVLPPKGGRDVLRTTTTQPFEPRNYVSPLSGFRSYWEEPKTNDVMMTVSGLPRGARIRIATLDSYDGVVYSVGSAAVNSASGSFTRVPSEFDQSGVAGKQVTLGFDLQNYTGVWLPTVGKLEDVVFSGSNATALRNDFFYNDTSGTAADIDRLTPCDSYTLDAVVPKQPTMAELARVDAGSATVPPLGTLPAELNSVLGGYVADSESQGAKLVAMIAALKRNGYVSHGVGANEPASRSGHAADRINELLTDPVMIGDAEQYSVTAALMATELGFPSRVVMGFVPETTGAGTSEIKGKDVSAWIEVDTAQYGWVTIDPNPPVRPIPVVPPKDPNQVARPQTIVPPPTVENDPPDPQVAPDVKQHVPPAPNEFMIVLFAVLGISGWVLLGILVVLSPFIVVLVAKARRRRLRRRAATALARITGGWQEFADSVVDHGFEPPPAATRSEIAAAVGGSQPAVLAAVTDRATFAPGTPDDAEGDLVWRSVNELVGSLAAGRSRWERIRASVSLRSLGGYSFSSRLKGRTNP
jgi:Transglutaminase-like superfamily